jgi:hypothetical protein
MILSQLKRPTQLVLSADTVREGASGRTVGTYSTTPTTGYTYAITADPSNKFTLSGADLVLDNAVDFDITPTLSVTVTASKAGRPDIVLESVITVTELSTITYFDAANDAGTTADYFVSTSGNDSNAGTVGSPFLTIQHAIDTAISAGNNKHIAIRDGTYREYVDLNTLQGHIFGYSTEKPIISALTPITGWAQCDSGDEQYVGSDYASIYKVTVATSTYSGTGGHGHPMCLNVHENGTRLPIVRDRATDTDELRQGDESTYHQADAFNLSGTTIQSITDATVFAAYTEAQMLNMKVHVWRSPNATTLCNITAYDSGTKTATITHLEPTSGSLTVQGGASYTSASFKYSLNNALPNFSIGRWGYRISGSDTIIYLWPNNTGNLAANIAYARFENNIDLDRANNIIISDMKFRGASGLTIKEGCAISSKSSSTSPKDSITIRNIDCSGQYSANQAYGILYLAQIYDLNVHNVSIDVGPGNFGIYCAGTNHATEGNPTGGYLRFIEINNCENSPLRIFGQGDFMMAYIKCENGAFASHANKMNFYNGCGNVLAWGIKFIDCDGGYVTWQDSSEIVVAMSQIPNQTGGRALVDQLDSALTSSSNYTVPNENYFFNLLCPPISGQGTSPSVNLNTHTTLAGHTTEDALLQSNYSLYNSCFDGGGIGWDDQRTAESNNVVTRLASGGFYGAAGPSRAWTAGDYDATTAVVGTDFADVAAVFTDYANGDYTPTNASSPLVTTTALDLETSGLIAALQARFPNFQYFDRDINFVQFDWASPFIGPDSTI